MSQRPGKMRFLSLYVDTNVRTTALKAEIIAAKIMA